MTFSTSTAEAKTFEAPVDIPAYSHPFNEDYNPLNFSGRYERRFMEQYVGPEMVSPHYENFSFSRKWGITVIGSFLGF